MDATYTLRTALKVNGAFSILSALTAAVFSSSILAVYEMAGGNAVAFASQLIVFGAFVLFNAFRRKVSRVMVIIIIVLDVLYILQVIGLLAMKWPVLSTGGITLIVLTTLAVASFAYFQTVGLKLFLKSRKNTGVA